MRLAEADPSGGAAALALLDRLPDPFDETLELRVRALVLTGEAAKAQPLVAASPFLDAATRSRLAALLQPRLSP